MKKLMVVSRCRRCGAETSEEACLQDQVLFEQNGYEWPRNGRIPLQVVGPALHECFEGSYGIYGYAGFDVVEEDAN